MLFSPDIAESYSRLKAALLVLLEGQNPSVMISEGHDYPLLVLETLCDSVGFAVVNGTPDRAFASAYDSFKHLYREKHTGWKERNLSFVVCRSEAESAHDAFFNSVETDVYFCRKYVVCLSSDQDELVRELLRLPFLPLPEGRIGGVLRPPSAQTLLQSLNVRAQVARQIIVPLEYSAKRIVEERLSEKDQLPAILPSFVPDVEYQAPPTERTRIRNVEIEAFRAYRKKQVFDVDADVVVLYGPNGLGKTSFFDAVDYVCTGRIGRFCRGRISQKYFTNLARHLNSLASDGYVSMQVRQGGTECSVRRDVADWGTALIGNEKVDRGKALQFLTSSHWEAKRTRIENLVRLFRATHLFNQSDPELLLEFQKDSTVSPPLVYRMLALDDYASGLVKVAAVLAQLDKQIAQKEEEISVLNAEVDKVQSQIRAMSVPQDAVQAGKQLRDMAARLVKDLQAYAGVTIDDIEPSRASAREWRAMAESALKDTQDRLRQLQDIESGFAQFEKDRSAVQSSTAELSKLEVVLEEKSLQHRSLQDESKQLRGTLEQERSVVSQAKLRLRALAEVGGVQEVFGKTNSSRQKWQHELERVAGEADATTSELQPLLPAAESVHARTARLREVVEGRSRRLQTLAAIQDGRPSWEKNGADITKLQQDSARILSDIQEASAAIDKLKTVIAANENELSACEREYTEITANQVKVTWLLDEIEGHVENGICPTCGIDHKSKAALVDRIHAQKQARPAHVEALAERRGELRNTLQRHKTSLGRSGRCARVQERRIRGDRKQARGSEGICCGFRALGGRGWDSFGSGACHYCCS